MLLHVVARPFHPGLRHLHELVALVLERFELLAQVIGDAPGGIRRAIDRFVSGFAVRIDASVDCLLRAAAVASFRLHGVLLVSRDGYRRTRSNARTYLPRRGKSFGVPRRSVSARPRATSRSASAMRCRRSGTPLTLAFATLRCAAVFFAVARLRRV